MPIMNKSPLRNVGAFLIPLNQMSIKRTQKEKNHRSSSCDGKMIHQTEMAVKYYIDNRQKTGIEDYYKCQFCDKFHTFTIKGKQKLSTKRHNKFLDEQSPNNGPRKMRLYGRGRNGHKGKR